MRQKSMCETSSTWSRHPCGRPSSRSLAERLRVEVGPKRRLIASQKTPATSQLRGRMSAAAIPVQRKGHDPRVEQGAHRQRALDDQCTRPRLPHAASGDSGRNRQCDHACGGNGDLTGMTSISEVGCWHDRIGDPAWPFAASASATSRSPGVRERSCTGHLVVAAYAGPGSRRFCRRAAVRARPQFAPCGSPCHDVG